MSFSFNIRDIIHFGLTKKEERNKELFAFQAKQH